MKKVLLISSVVIIAAIITGTGVYFAKSKLTVDKASISVPPTETPKEELITWEDQSGFTFQYPKGLKLNPHDEDQENYAHIELTSENHKGDLIVWAKDTNVQDLEQWVKQSKMQGYLDSTMGGEPAKKILTEKDEKKLVNTTLYGGYLYQIESSSDEYWNNIYDAVSSSFKFVEPTIKKETIQDIKGTNENSVSNQNEDSSQTVSGEEDVQNIGEEVIE